MTDIVTNISALIESVPKTALCWAMLLLLYPAYALCRGRRNGRIAVITAFSIAFYILVGNIAATALLIGHTTVDYILSLLIAHGNRAVTRRMWLIVSIVSSLALFIMLKYAVAVPLIEVMTRNFAPDVLIAPIGISFYTFRSISYAVDVYRRQIQPPTNPLLYVAYLTYFPIILAGPIIRSDLFFRQIDSIGEINRRTVDSGLFLIVKGLFKKAVLADCIAGFSNLIFANPQAYDGTECLVGLIGFGMQIYLDFSGYSDIAIGLSRTLGIELGDNFRSPYKACNLTDFWRRWHISLSSWLRDYVYIPLGGNRCRWSRRSINLLVTTTIGGVWHGVGAGFAVWGAAHGLGLIVQKTMGKRLPEGRICDIVYRLLTFSFVTALWIPFRSADLSDAVKLSQRILSSSHWEYLASFPEHRALWTGMLVTAVVGVLMPRRVTDGAAKRFTHCNWLTKLLILIALVQCILEFEGVEIAPFIYATF